MKNAVLIVVAFVLGAGAVWLLTGRSDAPNGAPQAAGGPRGGFGGGGPGAAGFGGAGQVPLVAAERVKRSELFDSVEALGTSQANESVIVSAKVTDTVRRVNFEDGDFADAGAVLVELTNQEEEALLAEARANLDDAQNALQRVEDLSERGLVAKSELDVARSRTAASQARLESIEARLSDRLIRAPFAGLLGFRQVSPGTLVTPSSTITSIDDISVIKLDFTVPETFLGAMQPNARVVAQSASYPNRMFEGTVRTVGSRVDPVTRAFTVRAHIPNGDRALRPGMLLTVEVVMKQRLALTIPENAVFQVQNRAYVYRLDGLVARQTQIEVGERRFGIVEVLAGLEEGDQIVSEGIVKLRDGITVRLAGSEPEVSERSDTAKGVQTTDARS
jgi:membrane fusion protein, multidrug efflux system